MFAALVPAEAVSAQSAAVALPPQSQGSCGGQVPIVVGSDAAAQSDIYAAAMLAGVGDAGGGDRQRLHCARRSP